MIFIKDICKKQIKTIAINENGGDTVMMKI